MKITPTLISTSLAACLVFSGCKTTPEQEKTNKAADTKPAKPKVPNMADQSTDVNFQAFVSRLRQAVSRHDVDTIASMMTVSFGYRLEPIGEGPGVFEYWDANNVWPELELVMKERFVPKENYMVAPAEFARENTEYTGYRAGIVLESGSWKFAYFVSGK